MVLLWKYESVVREKKFFSFLVYYSNAELLKSVAVVEPGHAAATSRRDGSIDLWTPEAALGAVNADEEMGSSLDACGSSHGGHGSGKVGCSLLYFSNLQHTPLFVPHEPGPSQSPPAPGMPSLSLPFLLWVGPWLGVWCVLGRFGNVFDDMPPRLSLHWFDKLLVPLHRSDKL